MFSLVYVVMMSSPMRGQDPDSKQVLHSGVILQGLMEFWQQLAAREMMMHADTAAKCSLKQHCVWLLFVFVLTEELSLSALKLFYSGEKLLHIRTTHQVPIMVSYQQSNRIREEIAGTLASAWIALTSNRPHRKRRESKQRRGWRSGYPARLKKATSRLPSLFVSNARSPGNKKDKLRLELSSQTATQDNCVMTETWFNLGVPVAATKLAGRSTHRSNQNENSDK